MPGHRGRSFSVDRVRIVSSDGTSLAATVWTPRGKAAPEGGRHAEFFSGHAVVMVHAHPKFGGAPEMMQGGGWEGNRASLVLYVHLARRRRVVSRCGLHASDPTRALTLPWR